MGALAESFGTSQGMKYRSRIKAELERVAAIDAAWERASALTALGAGHYLVPRLSRRQPHEGRRALPPRAGPVSEQRHRVALPGRIVDRPEEDGRSAHAPAARRRRAHRTEKWAPEVRDYKRKAADRLRALTPSVTSRDDGRPPRGLRPRHVRALAAAMRPQPRSCARRPSRRAIASGDGDRDRADGVDGRRLAAPRRRSRPSSAEFDRLDAMMSVWTRRQRHRPPQRRGGRPPRPRQHRHARGAAGGAPGQRVDRRHGSTSPSPRCRACGSSTARTRTTAFPTAREIAKRLPLINYRDLEVDDQRGHGVSEAEGHAREPRRHRQGLRRRSRRSTSCAGAGCAIS